MSEIFNKAAGLAKEKLSTQDNARAVLEELYGKTEEAYEKFEKLPIAEQILASMTPGIGNVIAAKEVDVFGGRAGEAFEKDEYGKAAGYGALTGLAALGTLPGVGILGRGAKAAIRSGAKLLDDPMEQAIKEVGEKATLPKTPSRVFGKELDEYTGPHSDFVRPEQGLKALDDSKQIKVVDDTKPEEIYDFVEVEKGIESKKYSKEAIDRWQKKKKKELGDISQRGKTISEVKKAADKLGQGGSWEDYRKAVEKFDPIVPFASVGRAFPKVPTNRDMISALDANKRIKGIVGKTANIRKGDIVHARLDIPAYEHFDTWIVSLKVPSMKKTVYGKTAHLKGIKFEASPTKSYDIATEKLAPLTRKEIEKRLGRKITTKEFGELRKLPEYQKKTSKSPFATMKGEWQNTNNEVIENRAKEIFKNIQAGKETEWIEVGFNPKRHGFFYSKIDGLPVTEAEEIIQVGPLVLAKKANKVNLEDVPNIKDFKTKEGITFKQGGQIATGLEGLGENIVYRQENGQVGVYGMGFDVENDVTYEDFEPIGVTGADLADVAPTEYNKDTPEHIQLYDPSNPATKKLLMDMQDRESGRQGGDNPWNPYGIKDEYNTPKMRGLIQRWINDGKLQGIGIEFANSWESEGLNTFGKNMRGPFEAWTPGKGLSRDSYDPGVLIGTAQFTDDYWKRKQGLASEEFVMRLQNAKPGETVADISAQYKEEFGEDPPIDAFGYNVNSTALASQVAESLNDARTSGAFQGAALMAGFGPGTLAQLVTTRYITNPEDGKSSVTDAFKDITSKGINIIENRVPKSWTATDIARGESALDIARSTVKKGLGILDLVTSPVSTISKWGLEKASEMFVPKSVLDATPKQIEVAKEKEPTITDTIKDTLSLNIGKRPLPSADIYEGENITEAVQSPSIEIASLPVAPEEDIANIYGEMSGYFSQPKPPRKNVFTDALLENIYQV